MAFKKTPKKGMSNIQAYVEFNPSELVVANLVVGQIMQACMWYGTMVIKLWRQFCSTKSSYLAIVVCGMNLKISKLLNSIVVLNQH